MILSKHPAAAFALLALPLFALPSYAAPVEVQAVPSDGPGGIWRGNLLQKDWTFEFTARDGAWSGRYRTPGGVNWYPLSDVVVRGRAISFTMDTKPKLRFALDIDAAKPAMTGTVAIEGIATVPFTATRQA